MCVWCVRVVNATLDNINVLMNIETFHAAWKIKCEIQMERIIDGSLAAPTSTSATLCRSVEGITVCRVDGHVTMKPCSAEAALGRWLWVGGSKSQCSASDGITQGYTNEFKEFMALTGDGASELSWPSWPSLLALFPLYWPINEPSSLNCPSPPSP